MLHQPSQEAGPEAHSWLAAWEGPAWVLSSVRQGLSMTLGSEAVLHYGSDSEFLP